ncbi:probable transporter Mch4p [[Candida] anglica]
MTRHEVSSKEPATSELVVVSDNDDEFPDGGLRANFVLVGSFLGLTASFGMLNSVGAIQAYLSQNQLKGVKSSTVSWIFSIFFCLAYSFGIFVGPFFDARGPKIPLIGGLLLISGGFMAVASCDKVWQFILGLSICVGVGNALCITPLIGVVSQWFYLKRGRATGLATTGGSVGGIVIPLMLRGLYPKVGFAWAIRILGFFSFGCIIVSIVLAKGRFLSSSTSERKVDDLEHLPPISTRKKVTHFLTGSDVRYFDFSNLLDWKYSFLIGGVFLEEFALMLIVTYFATYAITQGVSESDSYLMLTVFNATGIPGRWLPGYFSDIIGHFNVMLLMLTGVCLSIFIVWLPFGAHPQALWAFAAICGFFSASILSLTPVCLGSITPVNKFGERFGMMYFFVSIGNLFGFPMAAAIIGDGSKHNYDMFVVFCGLLAVTGSISWAASRYCLVGFKLNVKI